MVREAVSASFKEFHPDRFKARGSEGSVQSLEKEKDTEDRGGQEPSQAAGHLARQALLLARRAPSGRELLPVCPQLQKPEQHVSGDSVWTYLGITSMEQSRSEKY
jgi:hypothetical protein